MVALLGLLFLLIMLGVVLPYELSPEECLSRGDDALTRGKYEQAIQFYQTGIESFVNNSVSGDKPGYLIIIS